MTALSTRAMSNIAPNETRNLMGAVFTNQYSESKPNGVVMMGLAENKLILPKFLPTSPSHRKVFRSSHDVFATANNEVLTYGDGPSGTVELRSALATFINKNFSPREQLGGKDVTIINGTGSVIDALCFCIAEPGEGILIARPLYVGFLGDIEDRAGVKPICVPLKGDDVTSLASVARHEEALLKAESEGVKVRGLMLCSPHNPLGRCYAPDVIEAYLALCQKYKIHFISDEVYAKAVFPSKDISNPLAFTSVLSLAIEKFIDPSLVHVLYGMSKGFCANGLRIGAFISLRNPTLHFAMSAIAKFSWASSMSDRAWLLILRDEGFLYFYFTEMRTRMSAAYEICVEMLREVKITYVPANCGPFLWVDLSKFMKEKTMEEERKLAWKMIENGVWLATGEAFMSEEPGWFRITFAVGEAEFRFGMERLKKALVADSQGALIW